MILNLSHWKLLVFHNKSCSTCVLPGQWRHCSKVLCPWASRKALPGVPWLWKGGSHALKTCWLYFTLQVILSKWPSLMYKELLMKGHLMKPIQAMMVCLRATKVVVSRAPTPKAGQQARHNEKLLWHNILLKGQKESNPASVSNNSLVID